MHKSTCCCFDVVLFFSFFKVTKTYNFYILYHELCLAFGQEPYPSEAIQFTRYMWSIYMYLVNKKTVVNFCHCRT